MAPTFTIVDGAESSAGRDRRTRRKRPAYQALLRMSDRRLAERGLVRIALPGAMLLAPCELVHRPPDHLLRPCNNNRPVLLC